MRLTLPIAALLTACTGTPGVDDPIPDPLRVVTFNLRYDLGLPSTDADAWSHPDDPRGPRALALLDALAPDLLGLQEVLYLQRTQVAEHLTAHDTYAVGRNDGDLVGEACMIAWRRDRFTARDRGTIWLSPTPEVPGSAHPDAATVRIASWVTLDSDDGVLGVLNTHWDHVSATARRDGADVIAEHLATLPEVPWVVLGDLNAPEDAEAVTSLIHAADLVDAYRAVHPTPDPDEATFHGFQGTTAGQRIDHVLPAAGHFVALDAAIDRTDHDGAFPSDHYAVWADLQPTLRPPAD